MSELFGRIILKKQSNEYTAFESKAGGITFDIRDAEEYSLKDGLKKQAEDSNTFWLPYQEIYKHKMVIAPKDNLAPMDDEEQFAAELYNFLLSTELSDDFQYGCWSEDEPFYGYEIVDKPLGDKQSFDHDFEDIYGNEIKIPDKFKYIDHEYCDQHSYGLEGDSFYGDLYFPLPTGRYIRCHYQC